MTEICQMKQTAQREAKDHPQLANDIWESASLALGEIADGESPGHELGLFEDQLRELKEES
jgi:hypothetical protein